MKGLKKTVCVLSFLFWLMSCSRGPLTSDRDATLEPTAPPYLSWNNHSNARVLLAMLCCDSPTTEEQVRFYVPEAQLWGDGRFLWTTQDSNRTRQVFVDQLAMNEIRDLLREVLAAGFFAWDEEYEGEPVLDGVSMCLTVTLTDQNKTVCATHGGTPEAFYALTEWLSQGAGRSGNLYRPRTALLTGFQLEDASVPLPEPDVTWPEALTHVPVDEAINGFWLADGEALQVLWKATNRSPYFMPVVKDGDDSYRIILQVPGVSWIEP